LLADDLDQLQLAEELEQQGAILEELQRLLALQAEEQKLAEMLAALHDQDGADHQDTLPYDLADSLAAERSMEKASGPGVVVHEKQGDGQDVRRELFPPVPTVEELNASIAEAPGVLLADEILPESGISEAPEDSADEVMQETSIAEGLQDTVADEVTHETSIAEGPADTVADEVMQETSIAEGPEDSADEVMHETSIAEGPENTVADEVEQETSIAEGPEDTRADEIMPESHIAEAPEDPLADDIMPESRIAEAPEDSVMADSTNLVEASCTETEPESCEDHTKHYECIAPGTDSMGSKPALRRSDRVRPSILDGLAAISPAEQNKLARPKKGKADGDDEDSAEAPKSRGRGRGRGGRGRGRGRGRGTKKPDAMDEADKAGGPKRKLGGRGDDEDDEPAAHACKAKPKGDLACWLFCFPQEDAGRGAPSVDPKQAATAPKVSTGRPRVDPKQAEAPTVSTGAPAVDPQQAAAPKVSAAPVVNPKQAAGPKVSATAPVVNPKQAAEGPKVSTAAPPRNPKQAGAAPKVSTAAPAGNPKQAAPKVSAAVNPEQAAASEVSAAAPHENPKQAAPEVSSKEAVPEATRGSSFDSAWRYCATLPNTPLDKPQSDHAEKSPPGQKHRQMADNSFAWAASKGRLRTNEVHKTEEAKLIIEEKFVNRTERGSKKTMSAEGEDEDGYIMDDDVPGAEADDIVHKPSDGAPSSKSRPSVLQGEAEEDE
ncbi:FAM186A, partial [Symbiodinium sp. CCMP2456]